MSSKIFSELAFAVNIFLSKTYPDFHDGTIAAQEK